MSRLSLDLFLSAGADFEGAQYRILDRLKRIRGAFSRNIIYPHLGELVEVYGALKRLLGSLDDLQKSLPGVLKGIDPETHEVLFEKPELGTGHMGLIEDLIQWALPLIQDAIEEGRTIFEFVEDHLYLEEVGLVPSYVEEGYLLVPDRRSRCLYILQYNLSIFTSAEERFRSLKTTHVKTIEYEGIAVAPQVVKLDLLAERRELPNPATYFIETVLDFPYEPTVLPIAKRKLLRHLSLPGGDA
ncbi:hypothetical protein [Rhodocaloribacter sp.]